MAAISSTIFAGLLWGSLFGVLLVFLYECRILATEYGIF